ncbi:hypothetical protein [Lentzea kentuckyensis]|uniref:hypothetical protein n=1 Tax=Lentzea kentuckyensis TaxID=360086 RepID=UPI000A3B3EC3|nr:hypothetical protein [Lentzea kentuckyensis]
MSPRSGGEADKLGNYYEKLWVVWHLLEVIAGNADSITIEPLGELGEGAEFVLYRGNEQHLHQVKRQIGNSNEWSLGDLRAKGVLRHAADHTSKGRKFWFVSTVPARVLDELAGRALRSADLTSFTADLESNKDLTKAFSSLAADPAFGSPSAAWQALTLIQVKWPDETLIRSHNAMLAEVHLAGLPPDAAVLALGEIADTSISQSLDINALDRKLAEHGLRRTKDTRRQTATAEITSARETWMAGVEAELFEPVIPRSVAGSIVGAIDGGRDVVFAVGSAGGGKSAVLHQAVTSLLE